MTNFSIAPRLHRSSSDSGTTINPGAEIATGYVPPGRMRVTGRLTVTADGGGVAGRHYWVQVLLSIDGEEHAAYYSQRRTGTGNITFDIQLPSLSANTRYSISVKGITLQPNSGSLPSNPLSSTIRLIDDNVRPIVSATFWTNRSPNTPVITSPPSGISIPYGDGGNSIIPLQWDASDPDGTGNSAASQDRGGYQIEYRPMPSAGNLNPPWQQAVGRAQGVGPTAADGVRYWEGQVTASVGLPAQYITPGTTPPSNNTLGGLGLSNIAASWFWQKTEVDLVADDLIPYNAGEHSSGHPQMRMYIAQFGLTPGAWQFRVRTFDMSAHGRSSINSMDPSSISAWSAPVTLYITAPFLSPLPLSPINDEAAVTDPITFDWLFRDPRPENIPQAARRIRIRCTDGQEMGEPVDPPTGNPPPTGTINMCQWPSEARSFTSWRSVDETKYTDEWSSERAYSGIYSLRASRINPTSGDPIVALVREVGISSFARPAVTPGETYTFSVYIRPTDFEMRGFVALRFFDAGGALVGSNMWSSGVSLPANQWTRVHVTLTAPAGAASVESRAQANRTGSITAANGNTAHFDAALLTQGSGLWDFFDGNSVGAEWLGDPNGSQSRWTAVPEETGGGWIEVIPPADQPGDEETYTWTDTPLLPGLRYEWQPRTATAASVDPPTSPTLSGALSLWDGPYIPSMTLENWGDVLCGLTYVGEDETGLSFRAIQVRGYYDENETYALVAFHLDPETLEPTTNAPTVLTSLPYWAGTMAFADNLLWIHDWDAARLRSYTLAGTPAGDVPRQSSGIAQGVMEDEGVLKFWRQTTTTELNVYDVNTSTGDVTLDFTIAHDSTSFIAPFQLLAGEFDLGVKRYLVVAQDAELAVLAYSPAGSMVPAHSFQRPAGRQFFDHLTWVPPTDARPGFLIEGGFIGLNNWQAFVRFTDLFVHDTTTNSPTAVVVQAAATWAVGDNRSLETTLGPVVNVDVPARSAFGAIGPQQFPAPDGQRTTADRIVFYARIGTSGPWIMQAAVPEPAVPPPEGPPAGWVAYTSSQFNKTVGPDTAPPTSDYWEGQAEWHPWGSSGFFWTVSDPGSGPVIPDPAETLPGPGLGCGNNRVIIATRGGEHQIGEVTGLEQVRWDRLRDDISSATVFVHANKGCDELLASLRCWQHEIIIFRDNGNGRPQRVWEGPLTRITWRDDGVELAARDPMIYVYRRILRQGFNDAYNVRGGRVISRPLSVTVRASRIIQNALAYDDPNVLAYMRVLSRPDDARQSRVMADYSATAWQVVDDFAARAGLDYTTVGRAIILWDTHHGIGRLPELTDGDFDTNPIVTEYGMRAANHYGVTNGSGIYGTADHLDENGDPLHYGWLEMLNSAYGEDDEAGSDETLTEEARQALIATFTSQARRNIQDRIPAPVVVRVPDNSTLSPDLNVDINHLIPGVYIPLRSTSTLREVAQVQKLDVLKVVQTAAGETVQVTLSPSNSDDAEYAGEGE